VITFERYAEFLSRSVARVEPAIEMGLARVGDHALSLAKEYVGHEMPSWRPLTPDYVSAKASAGLTGRVSATDPWLLTGETLKSLAAEVHGHRAVLGATTMQALWNEVGTAKMQPRPLLALAMRNATDYAADVFGEIAVSLLVPPEALRR
jgi:hypothetical protein